MGKTIIIGILLVIVSGVLWYMPKQGINEEPKNFYPEPKIDKSPSNSLDYRCTEKVKGEGLCTAILHGVEFNQTTKKCELVQTGGCSVSGPFISTNYQDSGSQEVALRLCREICE